MSILNGGDANSDVFESVDLGNVNSDGDLIECGDAFYEAFDDLEPPQEGSQEDILERLIEALPSGWFKDSNSLVYAVLNSCAYVLALAYDTIADAKLQLRIRTATGGFLDMISGDFFGDSLLRKSSESDARFRNRILANLFRERATRASVSRVLEDITGETPTIFEPNRISDTMTLNHGYLNRDCPGSIVYPFQAFVTAYRPSNNSDIAVGYLNHEFVNQNAIAALTDLPNATQDSDIYEAINQVKPFGTTVWVNIQNAYD